LPIASRAVARDDLDEFRRTIASSLRLTFLLTIPSAIGLIVLSRPIISLIYERGRFDAFDTEQTAIALIYNAIGLTAYSGVRVLAPAFFALKDARIPMVASLLSIIINYAVASLTVEYLGIGHRGLALSISAVAIINFLFLFIFMRRRLGKIEGRSLAMVFIKVSAASCMMGAVCWLVSRQIERYLGLESLFDRLIVVGVSIVIGIAVLYPSARLMKLNEVDQLTELLKRKFGRFFRKST
jgi:putative peptidoglycan lipid II flippase